MKKILLCIFFSFIIELANAQPNAVTPVVPSQTIANTTIAADTTVIQLLKKQIEQNASNLENAKKQQETFTKQNNDLNEKIKQLTDVLEDQNNLIKSQTQKQESASQLQQDNSTKQNQQLVESIGKLGETMKTAKTEEQKWVPKKFGFGVNLFETSRLNISEQSYTALILERVPIGNAIVFSISTPHFRFEPEIGYTRITYNTVLGTIHRSIGAVGAGFFGMYQKGKTNIYSGARITFHYFDLGDSGSDIYSNTGISCSPTFGAEYAFAEHFTLGIEEAFVFYFSLAEVDHGKIKSDSDKFSSTTTQTRIVLRYYF